MNKQANIGLSKFLKSFQSLVKDINKLDGDERVMYITGLSVITEQMKELLIYTAMAPNKTVVDEIIDELEVRLDDSLESAKLDNEVTFSFPMKGKFEA